MSAEGNSYINQKRTEDNKKRYNDKYCSWRDIKEAETSHRGDEEEEDRDPAKKTKSEKRGSNGNSFGCANNSKVV